MFKYIHPCLRVAVTAVRDMMYKYRYMAGSVNCVCVALRSPWYRSTADAVSLNLALGPQIHPGPWKTMIIAEKCVHFHERRNLGTPWEVCVTRSRTIKTMIIAKRCVHFHGRRYLGTPWEVRASHSSASVVPPGCRSKHVKHNTNVESSKSLAINCVARMSLKACKTQYKRWI